MPSLSLPSDLSAGSLFSWQASLESRLERELTKHTQTALSRVKQEAMAMQLTPAFARYQWALAVTDTLESIKLQDSELESELIDLDLGTDAYDTAISVLGLGSLHNNRTELSKALDEALGLDTPSLLAAGGWISKLLHPAQALGSDWRSRVKRTVRTGFTGMTGRLVLAEMRRRGVTGKRWVSRHDAAVRGSHLAADGQVQPIDEPFNVGGEDLDYPGQKGKLLSETANCRCVVVPDEAPRR